MGLDLAASGTCLVADTGSWAGASPVSSTGTFPAATPGGRAASPRRPWHAWVERLCRPASVGLLLLGPLLAYFAYEAATSREHEAVRTAAAELLADRSRHLSEQVMVLAEVVHSCRGYFDASELVKRDEFATFTRQARARHAPLLTIAWAPRVAADDRARHETEVRHLGLPDYSIWQREAEGAHERAAPRPEHFPILYAEPMAGNEGLLGYDLLCDPLRADVLSAALAGDDVVLSDAMTVVQAPSRGRGALLMRAVRGEPTPAGPGALQGVVFGAFRFSDLLEDVLAREPDAKAPLLWIELFGRSVAGTPVRLYGQERQDVPEDAEEYAASHTLAVAGKEWRLRGVPTQRLLDLHRPGRGWLVAAAVLGGWELFAGFLVALAVAWRSQALRRQSRSVQLVLRSLGEGVVVADAEGAVRLANAAAGRILGQDPAGLRSLSDVAGCGITAADGDTPCGPEDLPLSLALAGRPVEPQELRVQRDVEESGVWVSASARPLLDESGVRQGAVMVLRDVTSTRRSEESIRRLSNAVEQGADAVFITDRSGSIQYVNPAFERISGYAAAEVLGKTPRVLKSGRHDAATYERIWATLLRGEVYRGTLTNRSKDGKLWVTAQTITPMKDRMGRVTHFVAVCQDMTERMRLQEKEVEMRLAADVQRRLYPRDLGPVPGLDLAAMVLPALETCGDYYDGMSLPNGAFALAVGDVSGKGLGPALVMAETRAYVRSLADAGHGPDEILTRVNQRLSQDLMSELFVTLLLVTVDPWTRHVTYANAGHPAGLLLDARGELKARMPATGTPLGMFDGAKYGATRTPPLEMGDCLVLVSDGATECPGPGDEMFEEEGILQVVRAHREESAEAIMRHLLAALKAYTGDRPLRDDVTILVAKGKAVPSPNALADVARAPTARQP